MGRGDKKTKRGKISMGTYGVARPAREQKAATGSKPEAATTEKGESKPKTSKEA